MPITIRKIARIEGGDYRVLVDYSVRGEERSARVFAVPAGQVSNVSQLQAAVRAAVNADADARAGRRPPSVPAPILALEGQTISEA